MIDIRKLKELVRLMVHADLTELDLRDGQEQVTLKRNQPGAAVAPQVVYAAPPAPAMMAAPAAAPAPVAAPAPGAAAAADDAGLVAIESPMVGTFYSASSPEKPPFANVGTAIGPDTVVCLIEAMKIFNEIKAERSGTIERVLVKNGQPVEFGQRLFLVRPS